jgi:hypothetical protein
MRKSCCPWFDSKTTVKLMPYARKLPIRIESGQRIPRLAAPVDLYQISVAAAGATATATILR